VSRGKLTVRLTAVVFGLLILGGAWLVSQDGSTSREASSPSTPPAGAPAPGEGDRDSADRPPD
jgi:hypothetical protein